MNWPLIFLIVFLLTLLIVRFFWLWRNFNVFVNILSVYGFINKLSPATMAKYSQTSGFFTIWLDILNWDFSKYIFHIKEFDDACVAYVNFLEESQKKILDILSKINETKGHE